MKNMVNYQNFVYFLLVIIIKFVTVDIYNILIMDMQVQHHMDLVANMMILRSMNVSKNYL